MKVSQDIIAGLLERYKDLPFAIPDTRFESLCILVKKDLSTSTIIEANIRIEKMIFARVV